MIDWILDRIASFLSALGWPVGLVVVSIHPWEQTAYLTMYLRWLGRPTHQFVLPPEKYPKGLSCLAELRESCEVYVEVCEPGGDCIETCD